MELMIQLAIIMVGKQFMNACLENLWPLLMKKWNSFKLRTGKNRGNSLKPKGKRYIADLKLVEFGSRGLFPEYLEMGMKLCNEKVLCVLYLKHVFLILVLQYGFVTIFVSAFPLAPLFALINNICEMRFDAKKLLVYHRRPVFARVRSIGIWYRILDCISKLSVITNGFIIAFTSDFVPRLVYYFFYSTNRTLDGYVEFTLARFDTSKFQNNTAPDHPTLDGVFVTECRYQDYRVDPGEKFEYERNAVFWNIMAARLIFVVLFENAVAIVMILVRWLIPDVSGELRDQIRREAYITNEIIIKQEAIRASQNAPARSFIKSKSTWNRLLENNLSGSQLDLFIHSENETRSRKRQSKKNKTQSFIDVEASNNNIGEDKDGHTDV